MNEVGINRRYVAVFLAAACVAALLTAGINYLVDPYGLFGVERLEGFNALKPASASRVRVGNPYWAEQTRPRTVIGGNSRPQMGLDPQSSCWTPEEQPVFNAGIPGASFRLQTLYAKHAIVSGNATSVLMGVDFLDFLTSSTASQRGPGASGRHSAEERRLRLPQSSIPDRQQATQRLQDKLTGLFSLVALSDSVTTVALQNQPYTATRRQDGFNPALEHIPMIRTEGQAVLFVQKNQELEGIFQRDDLALHDAGAQRASAFDALEDFLNWTRNAGLEATLFVNPYHADYLLLIEKTGKWGLLEEWKRMLVEIAERHQAPLWDFNVFDEHTSEQPPPPGDRGTSLQWFWEPAHYRNELGDLMLSALFDRVCTSGPPETAFGAALSRSMLEGHLEGLRAGLVRYQHQKEGSTGPQR